MSVTPAKLGISRNINLTFNVLGQATLLALLYTLLIFSLPVSTASMHAYHLSIFEYRIIYFAVSLPIILVWFAAFAGYSSLMQYARTVLDTDEGEYLIQLARGCAWLAWSLPITSIGGIILSSIAFKDNGFNAASIIISNYLSLILPLVAFSIIGNAAQGLLADAKLKVSLSSTRSLVLMFLVANVFYCYFTFSRFNIHHLASTSNPFYLPIWLMIVSVIIPFLYTWFIGLSAAYEIILYSKQSKGLIYKNSLRLLVAGIVTIIISSIALQYINGIEPRVGHLVLSYKLIIGVVFRLIGGIGFILLAYGALKLKKIEDV